MPEEIFEEQTKKSSKKKVLIIIVCILCVLAGILTVLIINKNKNNDIAELNNTNQNGNRNSTNIKRSSEQLAKNIVTEATAIPNGNLIVFITNNNEEIINMDVEVEFYDADGAFVGSDTGYVSTVPGDVTVTLELTKLPTKWDNYKIYVDCSLSKNMSYYDAVELTYNDSGEKIVAQVKNNSDNTIAGITVAVVYYKDGVVVGYDDEHANQTKTGRFANFNLNYPHDNLYENIEFDDYKVYLTEAYSYDF